MKKILFAALFVLPMIINAQSEGEVLYTETVKLDIEIPPEMAELMKDMPKSRTTTMSLLFKDDQSLFQNVDKDDMTYENRGESDMGESVIKMEIRQPDNKVFSDVSNGKVIEQRDLMGKIFLIEDDLKKYDWKVTSERRQILDHVCMRATSQLEDDSSVEAWFATDLSIASGPQDFNGLPGLIMMLNINEGERVFIAKKVDLGPIDESNLEMPSKGKKVNRKTYEEIEAKKMAEMNAVSGGNGVRMVIREEH